MIPTVSLNPMLADGALQFAFEKATLEGKITIGVLVLVSFFSWTVIFTKAWQLIRARRVARQFFEAYRGLSSCLDRRRRSRGPRRTNFMPPALRSWSIT